jgi:hypothetical protein
MGHDRQKFTRHAQAQSGGRDEEVATASFEQRLHQAVASLTGDARQIRAFQASPAAFLRRHQIDVRRPEGAGALDALAQLASRRLGVQGRPADPSREANTIDAVMVAPSTIHGDGLFTGDVLSAGSPICDVMVGEQVSHAASKINMSKDSNTGISMQGDHMIVTALKDIGPGEELVGEYPLVDRPSDIPPPRSGG